MIEIFNELLKVESNSILLLVGVGEKEDEIKNKIDELGIKDKVRFLGNRSDVCELYQAMDVFVLPSLFEGIPVVGVEAQFSDLPCLFSDKTPEEVRFDDRSQFIGLDVSANEWAKKILETKNLIRSGVRNEIKNSYYDIKNSHSVLETYYVELYRSLKV